MVEDVHATTDLSGLEKPDLVCWRSFTAPPGNTAAVFQALCLILGEEANWETNKGILKANGDDELVARLNAFDACSLSPETLAQLEPIVSDAAFSKASIEAMSTGAMHIRNWIVATYNAARSQ